MKERQSRKVEKRYKPPADQKCANCGAVMKGFQGSWLRGYDILPMDDESEEAEI